MREMKPKTKRPKRVADSISSISAAAEDRISGLPDALVCHILSFLPTFYAVRTCVLSRRWRNLWESVTTLDFDSSPSRYPAKLKTFGDYVLFFRNSSNIQKFRRYWKNNRVDLSHIDGWIRTAMKRNVTELDLHVEITYRCDKFYELPRSLFMCKTLVVLKLRTHCFVNVPASGCFPSLKILQVMCGRFSDDSMFKLFSNCPKLEDLTLDKNEIWGSNVSVVKVAAPSLKTLRICSDGYKEYNYSISCPKLENLVLKGYVLNKYCLGKAESLVQASIELLNHSSNKDPCFTSLLEGVSSVKLLCLSAHCFEVASLLAFDNLSKLKLVLHKCFSSIFWDLLMELLNRSPHLQHLVLEHTYTDCEARYYQYKSDTKSEKGPKPQWHAPELVPSCLVSHLETITIEGFMGQLSTMEMAKYILRNAEVLNMMTIYSDPLCEERQALHKELIRVPKVSKACVVDFV